MGEDAQRAVALLDRALRAAEAVRVRPHRNALEAAVEPRQQLAQGVVEREAIALDPLEQRLEDTRRQLGKRLGSLLTGRTAVDENLLDEIETTLITADIGVNAAMEIVENLRAGIRNKVVTEPAQVLPAVQAELFEMIEPCEQFLAIDESKKPFVILMVGVNGAGKTTTIGKLARRFKDQGLSVMLAAGDTFRAAAVEQLQAWGKRNEVPVIAQQSGADPAAVIFDAWEAARARGVDIVHDLYPYTASSTRSAILFPQWVLAGGPAVGAVMLLAEQLLHKEIDEIAVQRYAVTGPWSDPVYEKLQTRKEKQPAATDTLEDLE